MTKNDPVEKLIDLTARLIARAHLRRCSPQTQETNEQPDSPPDSETIEIGDTPSNQPDSQGEQK